jgi:Kef-type K+ transport system membrane component KefB
MRKKILFVTIVLLGFGGAIVGWAVLGSDTFISLSLGTGIFSGWLVYTLFRDVDDLYSRRPKIAWAIVLGTGVYMLVCLSLVYTFTAENNPKIWLIIPYSLGFLFLAWLAYTKSTWERSRQEQDGSHNADTN